MNKKLKKMIAAASAVAMCATSVVSMGAGAIPTLKDRKVTPYTTEFSVEDAKYHLWQKATDYFGLESLKIYITDSDTANYKVMAAYHKQLKGDSGDWFTFTEVAPFVNDGYHMHSEEELAALESYLSDKGIEYIIEDLHGVLTPDIYVGIKTPDEISQDERYDILADIKENTGFTTDWFMLEKTVQVTDIESSLPEQILAGDANEDGNTDIADAVYIMQTLSNPNDYKLTPQGMANADMDGNGVTAMDALTIQIMLLNQ